MSTFKWVGKSADGKTVLLHQLDVHTMFVFPDYYNPEWEIQNIDLVRLGAVVDVETSGLVHGQDKIIELGIRLFKFNRITGEVLKLEDSYSSLQDPGQNLSPEITRLTGITDQMVKDQKIDWNEADHLLTQAQIIVAHNAQFDRPFLDEHSVISKERVWACSFKQVDWNIKGLPSQKLEILSLYHGFFNASHRALHDADSLLYLLSLIDQELHTPYFLELITQARKSILTIYASASPFESKDILRERGYRWDNLSKVWGKKIEKEEFTQEVTWLETYVYRGKYVGRHEEISPLDQFKAKNKS